MILILPSVNPLSILFRNICISSVNVEFHDLYWISNSILRLVIYHRCVVDYQYMASMKKITTKLINDLEESDLICDCEGVWRPLLLLVAKPHQENCEDIHVFVWRLCLSYCTLKSITLGFQFSIPRYTDSIEDIGDSCGLLYKYL